MPLNPRPTQPKEIHMATAIAEKTEASIPTTAERMKGLRPKVSQLKETGFYRRHFWINAVDGVTQDDVRDPTYFHGIGPKLTRHDIITVMADDESWEMTVIIEAVNQATVDITVAKVQARKAIRQAVTTLDDTHHSEWRSGLGWCVVRRLPGKEPQVIISGHGTQTGVQQEWARSQPRPVL
jgi:hypothetical protein